MLEHQPSVANYGRSKLMARRSEAGQCRGKNVLPHRGFVTLQSWIENACQEEGLQAFG